MQTVSQSEAMDDYEAVRKARIETALNAMNDLGAILRREAAREGISLNELEQLLDRHSSAAKTIRLLEATAALQDEVAKNASEKGLDLNELAKALDRKRS